MKKILQITIPLCSILLASCGVDSGTPSSLIGRSGLAAISAGEDTVVRVKPASFGLYDAVINPHPIERRSSLYRLYKKEGRNFIAQEGFADEVSLAGVNGDVEFKLILNKEKLSTSTIGSFTYFEKDIDGAYQKIDTTVAEFRAIQSGDDETSAKLVFDMTQNVEGVGAVVKKFELSLDESRNVRFTDVTIVVSDDSEPTSPATLIVSRLSVEDVVAYGSHIRDVMMANSSCKRLTAGNLVGITEYTTNAAKSVEYRNCYWDLYDATVRKFVDAHQAAVADGDINGVKCRSAIYKEIKNELKAGKIECKNQFDN